MMVFASIFDSRFAEDWWPQKFPSRRRRDQASSLATANTLVIRASLMALGSGHEVAQIEKFIPRGVNCDSIEGCA